MEDQELLYQERVLALLRKDWERGAELLLETYTPLLWSVCQHRLSDPEDIKECINDVFTAFCVNLEKYDPQQASLKNYLAMLADRKAISYYRSNLRRSEAESAASNADIPDQTELRRDLEEALSRLQPEDARIIRLKYYGGMTYREIAKEMGIAEETAKKRGKRSLRKMAKWLVIGLLIAALLAGCTYVAHRYFSYIKGMGVVENQEKTPVYQMLDAPESFSVNDMTVQLLSVSYSEGSVAAIVVFHPEQGYDQSYLYHLIGGGYEMSVNGEVPIASVSTSDFMVQYIGNFPFHELAPDENGQIRLQLDVFPSEYIADDAKQKYDYDMDMSTLSWEVTLQEVAALQDLSDLGHCLETNYADYLILTDWEFSAETDDSYTFISLCPIRMTEGYSLSTLVSTCPSPLEGRTQEFITITDSEGISYPIFRMMTPSPEHGITEFTMCFKNLQPGEYTLNIPSLCYRVEGETSSFTFPLPKEDGLTVELDETLDLPNGSSIHFSGVSRETTSQSGIYMTEYWVDGVQEWVPEEDTLTNWNYIFAAEVSTNDAFPIFSVYFDEEFCHTTEEGLSPIIYNSGMMQACYSLDYITLGARDSFGMEAPDALTLTFSGFYYLDPQDHSISIAIE